MVVKLAPSRREATDARAELPDGGQYGAVMPPPTINKQASLVVDGTTTIAAKMATLIASKAESGDQGAQQALTSGSVSVADLLMVAQSVRTTIIAQKEQNKESAIDLSNLAANLISKSNELVAKLTAEGQSSAAVAEKLSEASYKTIFGDDAKVASAGVLAYRVNPDLGSSEAAKTTIAYEAIKAAGSDNMKPVDEAFRVESTAYRTAATVAAAVAAKTTVVSDFKTVFSACMSSPSSCARTSYMPPQPQGAGSTRMKVPGAPTSIVGTAIDRPSGTAGDTEVSLSWTAPATDGGSLITDYLVQYSSDDGINWTTFDDGISTSTSSTVTELANGMTYVFRVAARNAAGTGPYSSPSSSVKRPDLTDVTLGSDGTSRDNLTNLWWSSGFDYMDWWSASLHCAGLSYNGQSQWRLPSLDELAARLGNTTEVLRQSRQAGGVVLALDPSDVPLFRYSMFHVQCVRPSVPTPEAPKLVEVTAGNTQVSLTWSAPLSNSIASNGYVVRYSSDGGRNWMTFRNDNSTSTSATVTGLRNGMAYIFRVGAKNSTGTINYSSNSASVTPITIPGAPTSVTGKIYSISKLSVDDGLALTWTAPSNDGGSAITGYVVQYKAASAGEDEAWSTLSEGNLRWFLPWAYGGGEWRTSYVNSTNAWVMGLTPGIYYIFRVAAKNSAGTGIYSAPSSGVKTAGWSDVTVGNPYTERTMRDNITGLWWSYIHGSSYWTNVVQRYPNPNWHEARTFCDRLSFNGQSDWRLPSKEELLTARVNNADLQLEGKGLDQYYPGIFFWSGSTSLDINNAEWSSIHTLAWAVNWGSDRWYSRAVLNDMDNYSDVQAGRSFLVVCVRP